MTYNNVEEAYRKEFPRLLAAAKQHLTNQDYAIDCVHDAFEKTLEYLSTRPGKRFNGFILLREVGRAAKRYNKNARAPFIEYSDEIKSNDSRFAE